jgi:hypothetical protein
MKSWLPNAVSFQLVWVAAVGGASQGWWWAGPLALLAFAAWQLPLSRWPRADVLLMLGAALLGFALDTLWVQLDLMRFTPHASGDQFAPLWIVTLWMGFALTLNHSLAGLKRHLWMAAVLGVAGGPIAYGVAERAWAAVDLAEPAWLPLAALALAWGVVTPLLLQAASRLVLVPAGTPR